MNDECSTIFILLDEIKNEKCDRSIDRIVDVLLEEGGRQCMNAVLEKVIEAVEMATSP